ncbi:HD-GYP domain-containing protein [Dethiosulfatarculus sandiegensis]|uniref:Phosphohydrolase n=1 Tax=Dethiosulfatarculus sandiegensis TaxID=1429043 RepID=A0A0D2JJ01_9BACT|nr:HD domain-containing phosphohydrolase [Dethiosulfatarculus sandiegensis]KIX15661.1 phosphohydrolase [Dethiosulfatarculus sandiegensis]
MERENAAQRLLEVIQDVANGHYSNDIMELTKKEVPEPIRTIAESVGMMMVKVEAREFRLEQLNEQIKRSSIGALSAMAQALAARNAYTEGHASRVADLCLAIADKLNLEPQEVEYIRLGGLLHDIGKIGFSDALFEHHGAKTPPKLLKEIVRHPALGMRILKDLDFLGPAVDYVHCHHERLDGKGYPRHLKGDEIPLGAQIVAVADGYDAMTTDRPYQKGKTPARALEILESQRDQRLRGDVLDAFKQVLREKGDID